MNLKYFLQGEGSYLATVLDTDDEDYCLVIEIERVSRNGRHFWEATGSRRPVHSFVDLPRVYAAEIPLNALRAARIKYSEF